ncbi:MAG: hypothetical protein JNL32_14055 [Candidatus Kapabacteria bacterium]|nr:hypothetical protein [Candidatus Kapabacteria bacterium]
MNSNSLFYSSLAGLAGHTAVPCRRVQITLMQYHHRFFSVLIYLFDTYRTEFIPSVSQCHGE